MPLLSAEKLMDRGWEDPLDESPIDTPDGWFRGSVAHTGGGIYCRIWSTRNKVGERESDEPDTYFEAVYGSSFRGVDIDRYEYSEDRSQWRYEGNVVSVMAEERTDAACAKLAIELMEQQETPQPATQSENTE